MCGLPTSVIPHAVGCGIRAGVTPSSACIEALVHHGDFANYHSVLRVSGAAQSVPAIPHGHRGVHHAVRPLGRSYKYSEECIIEALAPTTELDFDRLDPRKQQLYRAIQTVHTHASPDGPWFFIIARSLPGNRFQLLGITDTAMLRPQVFACRKGTCRSG